MKLADVVRYVCGYDPIPFIPLMFSITVYVIYTMAESRPQTVPGPGGVKVDILFSRRSERSHKSGRTPCNDLSAKSD
jgi:hypothetical protein